MITTAIQFAIAKFKKRRKDLQIEADAQRFAELTREYVGTQLFPGMIENSLQSLTGAFVGELGLSKAQSIRACQLVAGILALKLGDTFGAPDMEITIPPTLAEVHKMGIDEFLRKNWPD